MAAVSDEEEEEKTQTKSNKHQQKMQSKKQKGGKKGGAKEEEEVKHVHEPTIHADIQESGALDVLYCKSNVNLTNIY